MLESKEEKIIELVKSYREGDFGDIPGDILEEFASLYEKLYEEDYNCHVDRVELEILDNAASKLWDKLEPYQL